MEVNLVIRPERAYLEMARCFHLALAVDEDGAEVSPNTGKLLPDDVTFALVANAYIMSYTAVIAFVNGQLSPFWENEILQRKFPKANTYDELTRKKEYLGDVKKALKELCIQARKNPITSANPALWQDFKNVVHRARNYYSHPKPYTMEPVVKDSFSKDWDFAPRTAARVIAYFYADPHAPRNEWLWKNTQFNVLKYKLANPKPIIDD
jgi:hypothetical protein